MDMDIVEKLEGYTFDKRWLIKKKMVATDKQSGSIFSIGYIVEKDAQEYFMKVFDFNAFFNEDADNMMEALHNMTSAHKHEKELSEYCKSNYVNKVVHVVDYGEEKIEGYPFMRVPYLIFELADGDVRKIISEDASIDDSWFFKSLHDIGLGLKQLHKLKISHQDLKPSNILVFNRNDSKIGDMGRSVREDKEGPFDSISFTGDMNYAPPEIVYGYYDSLIHKRAYATDCYLLGSLTVFYFTNLTMTALLLQHLPEKFNPYFWDKEDFDQLGVYLLDAFEKALQEFSSDIDNEKYKEDLVYIVRHLCHPNPEKRGHPKSKMFKNANQYDLQRFISHFNLLRHKTETDFKRTSHG